MSKIDEINRYIELTGVRYKGGSAYNLDMNELLELYTFAQKDWFKAFSLAFSYGHAKGERHARKELKKA